MEGEGIRRGHGGEEDDKLPVDQQRQYRDRVQEGKHESDDVRDCVA